MIEKLPEGAPNIATSKLKWDPAYQEKVGVVTKAAELDKKMLDKLERLSKRIYRTLFLERLRASRLSRDGRRRDISAGSESQSADRRPGRLCRLSPALRRRL